MKIKFLVLAITFLSAAATAQTPITDSGSFLLHKFAQHIGKETYYISKKGNTVQYDVNFKFVDRGQPVPLKAKLVTMASGAPVSLFIKGNTSRFSTINDTIRIQKNTASIKVDDSVRTAAMPALAFPVGGYSPGTVQMVLLQYWKKMHQPKTMALLPKGNISISLQGRDTLQFNNKNLVLERYIIGGLVWGNEIIWTDTKGRLISLITNDAEGDKLEMMSEAYETLLPELLNRAAVYGMKLFTQSMKMEVTKHNLLCLQGGKVLNIQDGSYLNDAEVLIEDGIIKQIGAAGTIKIPAAAKLINLKGKTIVPGLWDMHSHFQQPEWGPAYLAAGVTTVRDCGNEFAYINAIKKAIDSRQGVGPLILKAGIIDGSGPMGLGVVRAATAEEAVKAVDMYKNNGFAQIKIYSSVEPAIVRAITSEAHRVGLTVTGHIPEEMTTFAGIDSGMDQVNHIQYVYAMMKRNKDRSIDLKDSANVAALAFLKAHHTVIDPTIGVFEMVLRSVKEDILEMEPNFKTLPVPLQALFANMGMPEEQAKTFHPMFKAMQDLVKVLHDNGITIVAGTDMGFPGYSLARELELYVMSGLTPLQALQTATITPAQVMKMADRSGSVEAGKQADLLIVNDDPLTNIRNIRNVFMVIKEGQVYDPEALHKMVGFGKK